MKEEVSYQHECSAGGVTSAALMLLCFVVHRLSQRSTVTRKQPTTLLPLASKATGPSLKWCGIVATNVSSLRFVIVHVIILSVSKAWTFCVFSSHVAGVT